MDAPDRTAGVVCPWPGGFVSSVGCGRVVGLVLGYTLVSDLRGLMYSPLMFGIVGLIVGPFVGVAASWLHRRGWQAAAGSALLAGIAVGEGVYGLTAVAETTSPVYWILIAASGIVLLAWTVTRRVQAPRIRVGAVAMTAVTAIAFNAAYTALGSVAL